MEILWGWNLRFLCHRGSQAFLPAQFSTFCDHRRRKLQSLLRPHLLFVSFPSFCQQLQHYRFHQFLPTFAFSSFYSFSDRLWVQGSLPWVQVCSPKPHFEELCFLISSSSFS